MTDNIKIPTPSHEVPRLKMENSLDPVTICYHLDLDTMRCLPNRSKDRISALSTTQYLLLIASLLVY